MFIKYSQTFTILFTHLYSDDYTAMSMMQELNNATF